MPTWTRRDTSAAKSERGSTPPWTDPGVREVGGEADVALVEAQHAQTAIDEPLAPRFLVADALAAESVDHDHRRLVG